MKIVFLAGLICALCLMSVAEAAPAEGDIVEEPEAVNPSSGELAAENPDNTDRENSGTCSLGTWGCKVHCWAIGGNISGSCSGGSCRCY